MNNSAGPPVSYDRNEVELLIRCLLSSRKLPCPIKTLSNDYRDKLGFSIPLFGHRNLRDFLRSLTNTVEMIETESGVYLTLVPSAKSQHIVESVQRAPDSEDDSD